MKNGTTWIFACTVVTLGLVAFNNIECDAQTDSEVSAAIRKDSLSGPRLLIKETEVDLGTLLHYKTLSHTFEFSNMGDETLTLKLDKTSCGCVTDLFSGEPLEPGDTGRITVGYEPAEETKRVGRQAFSVRLAANDPDRPHVVLTVSARLVESMWVSSPTLDFGELGEDGSAKKLLNVNCYRDETTPTITAVETSTPIISVHQTSRAETDLGVCYQYEVELKYDKVQTGFRGSLLFYSDSDRTPILEVPVKATRAPLVEAKPRIVSFGIVKPEEEPRKTVKLANKTGDTIVLAKVHCTDPRVVAELEPMADGRSWALNVSLSPGSSSGRLKTHIEVFDSSGSKSVDVPVYAVIAGATP